MQNNNRLSAEDKKKLLPHQTEKPTISPHLADLSDQVNADYKPDLTQTIDADPKYASDDFKELAEYKLANDRIYAEQNRKHETEEVLSKIPGGGKFEK